MSIKWPELTLTASQEQLNYKHYLAQWLQHDVIRLIAKELSCALYNSDAIKEINRSSVMRWVTHVERMVKQLSQCERSSVNDNNDNSRTESEECEYNMLSRSTQRRCASILYHVMWYPTPYHICTASRESPSLHTPLHREEYLEQEDEESIEDKEYSKLDNSSISMVSKTVTSENSETTNSNEHESVELSWDQELVKQIVKVSILPLSTERVEQISLCEYVLVCVILLFHSHHALQEWSIQSLLHIMKLLTPSVESNDRSCIDGQELFRENHNVCSFTDAFHSLHHAWYFALLFMTCTSALMYTSPYLQSNDNNNYGIGNSKLNNSNLFCDSSKHKKTILVISEYAMNSLACGFMNVFLILNKLTDVLTKYTNQLSNLQNNAKNNEHNEYLWMQEVEKLILTHIHPVTPLLLIGEKMLLWLWKDNVNVIHEDNLKLKCENDNDDVEIRSNTVSSIRNSNDSGTKSLWECQQQTKHLSRWATAATVSTNTCNNNTHNYNTISVNKRATLPSPSNTFTYAELVKCITIKDKSFLRKLHTVSRFMHTLNAKLNLLTKPQEEKQQQMIKEVKVGKITEIKYNQTKDYVVENGVMSKRLFVSKIEWQQTHKSIIKVLIHALINTAKHHKFNQNTETFHSLQLYQLWCIAALLSAPTDKLPCPIASTVNNCHVNKEYSINNNNNNNTSIVKNVPVPFNSAGWLCRALLRNAFTQLHVTEAIALAKETRNTKECRNITIESENSNNTTINTNQENTYLTNKENMENKEIICHAIESVYALLSSLTAVLPPLVYTDPYFYSVLLENEQVLVSLAIGAIVKEHSECGVKLLKELMEVDVCQNIKWNKNKSSVEKFKSWSREECLHKSKEEEYYKHNKATFPSNCNNNNNANRTNLQRVWTNYPLLLHHFVKSVYKQEDNEIIMEESSHNDNIHCAKLLIKLLSLLCIPFMYSTDIAQWLLLCAPTHQNKYERLQSSSSSSSSSSSVSFDEVISQALQISLLHFITAVEETLSRDEERIKHIVQSYLQVNDEENGGEEKEEELDLITLTCFLELTNNLHLQHIGATLHRVLFAEIPESTWDSKVENTALYMWHKLILNKEMFVNITNNTHKNSYGFSNERMLNTSSSDLRKIPFMTLHHPVIDDMARAQGVIWLNILSHCMSKLNDVVQMELTRIEIEEAFYDDYYKNYSSSNDDNTSEIDENGEEKQCEHEEWSKSEDVHEREHECQITNYEKENEESVLYSCILNYEWSLRELYHSMLCAWWTSTLMCDVCVLTPQQWVVLVKSILVYLPSYEVIHKVSECLGKNSEEYCRSSKSDDKSRTAKRFRSYSHNERENDPAENSNNIEEVEKLEERTQDVITNESFKGATKAPTNQECHNKQQHVANTLTYEYQEFMLCKVQTHLLHCVITKHQYIALPSLIPVLIHLANSLDVHYVCKNKETNNSSSFTKTITQDLKPVCQRLHMMIKQSTKTSTKEEYSESTTEKEISGHDKETNYKTSLSRVLSCKNNAGTLLMHEIHQYSPPWFVQCFESAYAEIQDALHEQERRFEQYEWEEYVSQVEEEERKQAKLAEQQVKRQNTKLREVEIVQRRQCNGEHVNTLFPHINTINNNNIINNRKLEEWGNDKPEQEPTHKLLECNQKKKIEEQKESEVPTTNMKKTKKNKKEETSVMSDKPTSNKTQTVIAIHDNKLSVNTPLSSSSEPSTKMKFTTNVKTTHVNNIAQNNFNDNRKEQMCNSVNNSSSSSSSSSSSYVDTGTNLQITSTTSTLHDKSISHIANRNDHHNKPSGPSSLQKKVALIQQRQQWEQMHVEHQVECEAAIRRIAARTNVWHTRPVQIHDIIGNASHAYCHNSNFKNNIPSYSVNNSVNKSTKSEDYMIEELPMIPEIFISTKQENSNNNVNYQNNNKICEGVSKTTSSSSLLSSQTTMMNTRIRFSAAALAYAHCFAPHIALELRYEIISKFDDMMDLAGQHYNREQQQRQKQINKRVTSEKYNDKEREESNKVRENMEIQHNTSSKRYFDYNNSETWCDENNMSNRSSISNALYNSYQHYHESNNYKRKREELFAGYSSTPNLSKKCNEITNDVMTSLSHDFPLNPFIARNGIQVINTLCHPADPLDPTRITFSITAHCNINTSTLYDNNNNNNVASMTSFMLQSELNEGDVVVVLLPLAVLLPMWVEYMQHDYDSTTSDNRISSNAENDVNMKITELLDSIPSQWRVLGCYPQICVVAGFPPGQRNALLCTYPQHSSHEFTDVLPESSTLHSPTTPTSSSSVTGLYTANLSEQNKNQNQNSMNMSSSNISSRSKNAKFPHIPFLHALQMCFTTSANSPGFVSPPPNYNNNNLQQEEKQSCLQRHQTNSSENTFYVIKLTSINASLTAIYAIHQIYHTRFAPTLFDPRSTSHDSELFHCNISTLFNITNKTTHANNVIATDNINHRNNKENSIIMQIRSNILLEEKLNDWQIQAIAAVLYAVKPHWLPLDTLHNTIMTKYNNSNNKNNNVTGGSCNYNMLHKSKHNGVEFTESNKMSKNVEQLFYPSSTLLSSPLSSNSSSSELTSLTHTNAKLAPATLFMNARTPEIILIEGPPGTGKTQTIASLCINLLNHLSPSTGKVLLCAPSNCAVDEALLRTIKLRNQLEIQHEHYNAHLSHLYSLERSNNNTNNITITRVGVRESVDNEVLSLQPVVYWDDMVDEIIRNNNSNKQETINDRNQKRRRENNSYSSSNSNNGAADFTMRMRLRTQILNEFRLIFSTLGSLNQIVKCGIHFDVVIVDEASQGTEPDVLQALMLASSKCVLVGDSKQLQPTILCPNAASHGLKRSLLMRLLHNGHSSFMLRTQYRMHMDIVRFPNLYFYKNKLITPDCVLKRSEPLTNSSTIKAKHKIADDDGITQSTNEQKKQHVYNNRCKNSSCTSELEQKQQMQLEQNTSTKAIMNTKTINVNWNAATQSSTSHKHESIARKLRLHARLAFVNVGQSTMQHGRGHSLVNYKEVDALLQCMRQLRCFLQVDEFTFAEHVGIITFYKAQRDAIMQRLTRREKESKVQVATVDSFQGKEKDIILISCVRTLPSHEISKIIARKALSVEKWNKHCNYDNNVAKKCNQTNNSAEVTNNMCSTEANFSNKMNELENQSEEEEQYNKEQELTSEERHNDGYKTQDTRLGFLSNWHRINVALTRARELCVVFGHAETFMASALSTSSQSVKQNKQNENKSKYSSSKVENREQNDRLTQKRRKEQWEEEEEQEKNVIDVDNDDDNNVNQSQTEYKATTLDDTQETIERELHKADDDPCVLSALIEHTMKCDTLHKVEPEQILNIAEQTYKNVESINNINYKEKNKGITANEDERANEDGDDDDDSSVFISSQPFRENSTRNNEVFTQARFITWKPCVKLMDELAL